MLPGQHVQPCHVQQRGYLGAGKYREYQVEEEGGEASRGLPPQEHGHWVGLALQGSQQIVDSGQWSLQYSTYSVVQCTVYIIIASRTIILGFNSTNIRCPSPV